MGRAVCCRRAPIAADDDAGEVTGDDDSDDTGEDAGEGTGEAGRGPGAVSAVMGAILLTAQAPGNGVSVALRGTATGVGGGAASPPRRERWRV